MFTALAVRPALPEANRLHCLIFARFCISNVLNPIYREFCGEQNLVRAGVQFYRSDFIFLRPQHFVRKCPPRILFKPLQDDDPLVR